jgi:hypothetical protein
MIRKPETPEQRKPFLFPWLKSTLHRSGIFPFGGQSFPIMLNKFVIVGPEDHNGIATFWNAYRGWGGFDIASIFGELILTLPLPQGSVEVMEYNEAMMKSYRPTPARGGEA